MKNRPGRIFYMLEYEGLDEDFIREYCEDNLNNISHIEKVIMLSNIFTKFNFDMLKALIEDMNRYNESPQDVLKILNAKPEYEEDYEYSMEVFVNNVKIPDDKYTPRVWSGKPLSLNHLYVYVNKSLLGNATVIENTGNAKTSDDEDDDKQKH